MANLAISIEQKSAVVTKEVSDIVLLDDDLRYLPRAIQLGYHLFKCLKKFLQFELVLILTYIIIVTAGYIFNSECPFSIVQIFWMSLLVRLIGCLSFASEPLENNAFYDQGSNGETPFMDREMGKNILMQVAYQATILLSILFALPEFLGMPSSVGAS